jgi:membrane peptidoglycan carboxypeptidase
LSAAGRGPGHPRPDIPRRASARGRSRAGQVGAGGPERPGFGDRLTDFLRRRGGWIALGGVLLLALLFGYVLWTLRDMPDPGKQDVLANTITVYDRNGKVIEQRNSQGQFHDVLTFKDMGRYAPAATLAAEDRNFYHHGAIDLGSTLRAAFVDLTSRGYSQGGSTITQQLIKIQLLTPQKSLFRKLQEAILAIAVEQRYSKDQILEMYLNRVYYGHNAYGIGAATQTYFGKDKKPSDLTPAQAAFLAGLIQAPVYYDPATHYDRAKARQQYVLEGLVATRVLTQAQADEAAKEDIKSELKFDTAARRSAAPHFVDYALSKLEAQYGSAAIQQGGFNVYTTLDLNLQALADKSVKDGVRALRGGGVNNGMLLAAKPDTGEILAWVGSVDYYDDKIGGQFDVITAPRQPGSSFKPYVYEAALKDHKITLATTIPDRPTDFGNNYRPLDFDNRFMGNMSARTALVLSRNVPAVKVGQDEGMSSVINLAHAMGITSDLNDVPSTAIGASEITMYEHLQGYQTFANQGQKVPLMAITKITDGSGDTLYQQDPGQQDGKATVLTPAEAYLITDVLKNYQTQWDLGWTRQMASKSGTTGGSQTGIHKDAWMMAYNPDVVVGAWGGNTAANGSGTSISTFGTEVGQTMLAEFVNGLPGNMRDWYKRPDGIVDGHGCPGNQDASHEIFLVGTQDDLGCSAPSPSPSPTPSSTPTHEATPPPATPPQTPVPVPSIVATPPPSPRPTAAPTR